MCYLGGPPGNLKIHPIRVDSCVGGIGHLQEGEGQFPHPAIPTQGSWRSRTVNPLNLP